MSAPGFDALKNAQPIEQWYDQAIAAIGTLERMGFRYGNGAWSVPAAPQVAAPADEREAKRDAAERTLESLGYSHTGGEQWRPPLGPKPKFDLLNEMRARKDAAYLERNQVVAALASAFPSGTARTAIEGWSEDWHGCVYIDFPTGQASWHYHDSQAHLFAHLPPYAGQWDGHSTEEKYRRLAALAAAPAAPGGVPEASRPSFAEAVSNLRSLVNNPAHPGVLRAASEFLERVSPGFLERCAQSNLVESHQIAPGGVRPSDDTVSREDFEILAAEIRRAENLLVQLHEKHPEARSQIEASTGSWFVWGVDRDADRPAGAGGNGNT